MKNNQHFNPDEIWESIEIPENLDLLIKESVEEGYKRMQKKAGKNKRFMAGRAAAAVGIVALGCAAAIPVSAIVKSFVQERMEQIPAEEIQEVESVIDVQQVNADTFSREYSEKEKERYGNLYRSYQQGTFPEGELKQERTKAEGQEGTLYYAQDTSTFYLPDRELTDEELLQIIEFNTKRDYALEQRAKPGTEDKEVREQIARSGGISEEKAIELGTEWLHKLYGISEQGMELNHYPDADETGENASYMVNFSVQSVEYYYFYLDAKDGALKEAFSSLAGDIDAAALSVQALEAKKEELCQKAWEVLGGPLQKGGEYERIICAYRDVDGKLGSFNRVSFYFINKDGSACQIVMNAGRDAFMDYRYIPDYSAYEQNHPEERGAAENGKAVYGDMNVDLK